MKRMRNQQTGVVVVVDEARAATLGSQWKPDPPERRSVAAKDAKPGK